MRRIFDRSIFLVLLIILSVFIILIFSCSLNDIATIAKDPDFDPKWDVDLKALIVDYSTSPISFENDIIKKALDSAEVTIGGLTQWPVSVTGTTNFNSNIPVDCDIYIDSDGVVDFIIEGYYKPDPNILRLQVWLTDSSNNVLSISGSYITLQNITIEGSSVNLGSPVSSNNILNYYSTNFLDPTNEYYLDLGGDDDLDFSFDVVLTQGAAIYSGDTYTLHVKLSFNLGDDFGVVGEITDNAILKNISNQAIPINNLPLEAIDNFHLMFEYESNLAFDLVIENYFYGSDKTPSPPDFDTTIASGVLTTSVNGYDYVSAIKKSKDEFKFNDNILDYGDISLDLLLTLPTPSGAYPTGDKIRLDTDSFIKIKVIASGEATISL